MLNISQSNATFGHISCITVILFYSGYQWC